MNYIQFASSFELSPSSHSRQPETAAGPARIVDGRDSAEADAKERSVTNAGPQNLALSGGGFKFRHSVNTRALPNSPAVRLWYR